MDNNNNNQLAKGFEVNRYNIGDYLYNTDKLYSKIPQNVIDLLHNTYKEESDKNHAIAMYVTLFFYQDEYNSDIMDTYSKCKKYFGLGDKKSKKILDKLEEIGLIIQKRERNKKIIFVQYPEYKMRNKKSKKITMKEKIIEREIIIEDSNSDDPINIDNIIDAKIIEDEVVSNLKEKYKNHENKDAIYKVISNYQDEPEELNKLPECIIYVENKNPDSFLGYLRKTIANYEEWDIKNYRYVKNTIKKQKLINQKTNKKTEEQKEQNKIDEYINNLKNQSPIEYEELYNQAFEKAKSELKSDNPKYIELRAIAEMHLIVKDRLF